MISVIFLLAVAVYVAIPVFTGKGKLMQLQYIKEGREKATRKGLRIAYLVMFICSLLMAGVTYIENNQFTVQSYTCTFTEDFTAADGTVYTNGQTVDLTPEEYQALASTDTTATATAEPAEAAATEAATASETADTAAAAETAAPTAAAQTAAASCMASSTATVPCTVSGANLLASGIAEKFPGETGMEKYNFIRRISLILFGLSAADIVFLIVFIKKNTDKAAKAAAEKEAAAKQGGGRRAAGSMPRGAFVFDDEDMVKKE